MAAAELFKRKADPDRPRSSGLGLNAFTYKHSSSTCEGFKKSFNNKSWTILLVDSVDFMPDKSLLEPSFRCEHTDPEEGRRFSRSVYSALLATSSRRSFFSKSVLPRHYGPVENYQLTSIRDSNGPCQNPQQCASCGHERQQESRQQPTNVPRTPYH